MLQEVRHLRVPEDDKNKMIASGEARTEDCTPSIKVPAKDEPPGRYFDVMLLLEDDPRFAPS